MNNIASLLLGFSILVVSTLYILDPFRPQKTKKSGIMQKAGPVSLQTQRHTVLTAIRDLDFDYQAGKVNEEDYQSIRAQLVTKAAGLIETQKQEDQSLETLIAARKQQLKKKTGEELKCRHCGRLLSSQDAFCPGCGKATGKKLCPQCGTVVADKDVFCTGCGKRLEKETEGSSN